jgi:hypothetical protein
VHGDAELIYIGMKDSHKGTIYKVRGIGKPAGSGRRQKAEGKRQ